MKIVIEATPKTDNLCQAEMFLFETKSNDKVNYKTATIYNDSNDPIMKYNWSDTYKSFIEN